MKLVFPGGELPQVVLRPGANRVGSAPDSHVVIDRPGVRQRHCLLHLGPTGVMLDVPGDAAVSVNGKAVSGLIALRDGDRVAFDRFEARLAAMEDLAAPRAAGPGAQPANDELFATTVRQALPKFMLRGVSGSVFGRSYALAGLSSVGRAPESTVRLDESGISRAHARLLPSEAGVHVEDLGSTNGTFVNGKRVVRGEAKAGDEIGFDTLRFRLLSTAQGGEAGQDDQSQPQRQGTDPRLIWGIAAGVVMLAAALFIAL